MEDLKQKNENLGRDAELAIKALLALECMTELQLLLKTKFEEMEDEIQNLGQVGWDVDGGYNLLRSHYQWTNMYIENIIPP